MLLTYAEDDAIICTSSGDVIKFGDEIKMKKIIAMMLAAAMVFALSACGSSDKKDEAAESTASVDYSTQSLDELKSEIKTVNEGKLTVATSPDYAPYEFYAIGDDGKPTLAGFDVAIAGLIADKLGLQLDVVPMDFDGTLAEMQSKKVDLGIAGYSSDPKREGIMSFSHVYYMGEQALVTTKANADKLTSIEAANDSQYHIAAQTGSIQLDLAKENFPNADVIELSKVTDIIAELISGKLDGAVIEKAVAEAYQKQYPDLVVSFDIPYETGGKIVGVNKDNEALLAAVNLIIDEALQDGTIDKFVAEANELALGNKYEGLLDENGNAVQATEAPAA